MKRTLFFASVLVLSSAAFSQNVFRCFNDYTTSYGPTGSTATFQGQDPVGNWTALPERGSQMHLDAAGTMTELSFNYLTIANIDPVGGESVDVAVYALDATNGTSPGNRSGNPYTRPATNPLFKASNIAIHTGDRCVRVPVPGGQAVPQDIVVTYHFHGGNFDTEPKDPALNLYNAGGRFVGLPTHGSLPTTPFGPVQNGLVWRRVFTNAGASTWGVQEVPATFGLTGWSIGFSVYLGSTSGLTTPWNNEAQPDKLWAYVDASFLPHGQIATVEGPNRKLTNGHIGMYVDTTSNPGGGSFKLALYPPRNGGGAWGDPDGPSTPDVSNPLFVSAAQAIPGSFGTAGSGTRIDYDVAIPGITVPEEFVWTIEITGLNGGSGDNAGPGLIFAPEPGTSANGVFIFNNSGGLQWEGPFVYEANVGGLYTDASQLDGVFTGGPATSTEVLAPTADVIVRGTQGAGGNTASWAANDGNRRKSCKFFVPNQNAPFLLIDLSYTTTKLNPTAMSFQTRIGAKTGGAQDITIAFLKKNTTTFVNSSNCVSVTVGTLPWDSPNATPSTVLSDYVGNAGLVKVEIQQHASGFQSASFPCTEYDSGLLTVTG